MFSNEELKHISVIKDFLSYLNTHTNNFILKGGTSLLLFYNLNRFSEDVDLDSLGQRLLPYVTTFCNIRGYTFSLKKNTQTVERVILTYDSLSFERHSLKIEVSYRNSKMISPVDFSNIDGVNVYTVDKIAYMKSIAYSQRDRLRDLFDLCFLVLNYYPSFSPETKNLIFNSLSYKGIEQLDYLLCSDTQPNKDNLIDSDLLYDMFLTTLDKMNIIYDNETMDSMTADNNQDVHPLNLFE